MSYEPKALSWSPPEGGTITFAAGTTADEVAEFIVTYRKHGKKDGASQPRIDVTK